MINLNIQRFGHTNSTSNYELPQFIGTDKPQWLTDINQAFASIDSAIHGISVLANLNSTNIGDLTELTTSDKSDLVSAINEVDSNTDSNTNTIAGHTIAISSNTTAIGDITDLDTVDKSDLVSAINEVDLLAKNNAIDIVSNATKIGTLSNLDTNDKSNLVVAINEVLSKLNLNSTKVYENNTADVTLTNCSSHGGSLVLAKNSDGSLFKLYGKINVYCNQDNAKITLNNTGLIPDEEYTVRTPGIFIYRDDKGALVGGAVSNTDTSFIVKTNGTIEIPVPNSNAITPLFMFPCMYINKNFGDTPE